MNTVSEKEFYSNEFREIVLRYEAAHFIWGEELINRKLVIYPKKLQDIQGYDKLQEKLEPCELVIVNVRKKEPVRCVAAMLDSGNGNVYLMQACFPAVWKQLKGSVNRGIRMAEEKGEMCEIRKPEEIIDLSHLVRKNSSPYIKENEIRYQERRLTEEERLQNSRKQSLLDNPKMKYFYSSAGGYFHDKECEMLKDIPAGQFCASEEIPEGWEICPECRRKIYFRKACAPNTRQIPVCDRIFRNHHVSNQKLMHFVMDAGLKFHAASLEEMMVVGGEDTWLIKGKGEHELQLWHNNYVKTSETERYITEGFHNQGLDGRSLVQMLNYIEGYTWERHLRGEAVKAAAAVKEDMAVQAAKTAEREEAGVSIKMSWYERVKAWIGRLMHK